MECVSLDCTHFAVPRHLPCHSRGPQHCQFPCRLVQAGTPTLLPLHHLPIIGLPHQRHSLIHAPSEIPSTVISMLVPLNSMKEAFSFSPISSNCIYRYALHYCTHMQLLHMLISQYLLTLVNRNIPTDSFDLVCH